jgi:hypothetical protein
MTTLLLFGIGTLVGSVLWLLGWPSLETQAVKPSKTTQCEHTLRVVRRQGDTPAS